MKGYMDDGEFELSDNIILPNSNSSSPLVASSHSFLDDLLIRNAQTCTHTHTCDPPGPDAPSHTHTCHHTHTRLIPPGEENGPGDGLSGPNLNHRRPVGNREAVRKYREKKKAHDAYLEEEVRRLRLVNQFLNRKLQRRSILETELSRLRGLLLDLRGKVDNELGDFQYGRQC